MIALSAWQDAFAAALRAAEPTIPEAHHPAFTVYRNTVWKGWIDAIAGNFPAVANLVGEDWMAAAAGAYATDEPPASPMMSLYGEGFPDFLASFAPAADLPYLCDIARLDRAWTTAHLAPDAPPLDPDAIAGLDVKALANLTAVPHPSLSTFWFETTVPTLWLANREDFEGGELIFDNRPEGILLARPCDTVEAMVLNAPAHAFIAACQTGRPLLQAVTAAFDKDPAADLVALIGRLLAFGAFTQLSKAQP